MHSGFESNRFRSTASLSFPVDLCRSESPLVVKLILTLFKYIFYSKTGGVLSIDIKRNQKNNLIYISSSSGYRYLSNWSSHFAFLHSNSSQVSYHLFRVCKINQFVFRRMKWNTRGNRRGIQRRFKMSALTVLLRELKCIRAVSWDIEQFRFQERLIRLIRRTRRIKRIWLLSIAFRAGRSIHQASLHFLLSNLSVSLIVLQGFRFLE